MRSLRIFYLVTAWMLIASQAQGELLQLPLTLDMVLLRSLIVQQAYPLTGEQASILNHADSCNQITLSTPQITEERGQIRFQTKVQLKWGTPIMESCLAPFTWEGSVVLWQRPRVNAQWQLSFATINSAVLDKNGRPMQAVDLLWNLIKDHVHEYLNKITVNLAPPINEMKICLLPMFDRDHQNMAQRFFASMRPDHPSVQPDGLRVNILAEIELPRQELPSEPVPQPNQQDYSRVIGLWHTWDNFLILQLKHFTDAPLTEADRRTLLDTMLTVRYEFTDAIEHDRLSNPFIRRQFLWSWNQLAPVFRNHLQNRSKTNILGYLAFFTAHDALQILDRLGPAVGIEISADGFRRLAAMISPEPFDPTKPATEADQKLRKVLGLEPLPDTPLPADKPIPLPTIEENDPTSRDNPFHWQGLEKFFSIPQVLAGEPDQLSQTEIKKWTAELTPSSVLLPKVCDVLQAAAERQQKKLANSANTAEWFEKMTLAAAWQESCFRQFHINNKAITYLLSSNRTSVGVLQVNEQIWHGVYNIRQLRWNINYNSQAGCEIMALYLRDYLHEEKPPIDVSTPQGQRFLAAWLYALYNGGPGQLKPFLNRFRAEKLFRSEQLFLAKFDTVKGEEWGNRVHCLP